MIENTGPDFSMSEQMIRDRQKRLLDMTGFKLEVDVNT